MSLYLLIRSKPNAAFGMTGIAIRAAYVLGVHREDSPVVPVQQRERTKTWRSLFILDRVLASMLGRPFGIQEDESTSSILRPIINGFVDQQDDKYRLLLESLNATVRACYNIEKISLDVSTLNSSDLFEKSIPALERFADADPSQSCLTSPLTCHMPPRCTEIDKRQFE